MATLNLYVQMIGTPPTEWWVTPISLENGVWMAGTSNKRSSGLFIQRVAEGVWQLFDRTRRACNSPFDSLTATSAPDRGSVSPRDLLCYVCESKMVSVIKRFDPDAFEAGLRRARQINRNGQVDGLTSSLAHGICSEVYLDTYPPNLTSCINNVYHECMHNKTNWALHENPEWVHDPAKGGGGLALPGSGLSGLTDLTAGIMCGRLMLVNPQFLDGIPMPGP